MKIKRFSTYKVMNTKLGLGFDKNRKYDTDLDRLGRTKTGMSEIRLTRQLNDELRETKKELRGYGL